MTTVGEGPLFAASDGEPTGPKTHRKTSAHRATFNPDMEPPMLGSRG